MLTYFTSSPLSPMECAASDSGIQRERMYCGRGCASCISLLWTCNTHWLVGGAPAELPWEFLLMLCTCAPAECKALLASGGGRDAEAAHLTGLLLKALEHADGMLHQTAVSGKYVSTVKALITRRSFWWHVLVLAYCCSTSCQYMGVGKFAHELELLR
jgi:hypothetical protein